MENSGVYLGLNRATAARPPAPGPPSPDASFHTPDFTARGFKGKRDVPPLGGAIMPFLEECQKVGGGFRFINAAGARQHALNVIAESTAYDRINWRHARREIERFTEDWLFVPRGTKIAHQSLSSS
jgi:hypothetical protein